MTGIRGVLIACLLSLCGVAWGASAPAVPAGARIGIIDIVTNDITHYHVGRTEANGFLRTYRGEWTPAELIDEPLVASLSGAGFQPVMLEPSPTLMSERTSWLVEKPLAKKLPRGCMKELERIMAEQNLGALLIAAPGANSEPQFDERNRMARLPGTTQGFGFSTSDETNGITKPAVFDFTQMILVVKSGDGAQLALRDWGGIRLYDWAGFDPGANLKALSDAQLAPLRPVLAEVIKRRIDSRVVPTLKP